MLQMDAMQERNLRFKYKKKRKDEPRVQGYMNIHRRGKDLVNDWPGAVAQLRNEMAGSVLAKHNMAGDLSYAQTSAGRFYASLAGQFDHFFNVNKRQMASPAYERGYGADDEVQRHMRDGTVSDYERRAKRLRKRWDKVHIIIGLAGPTRSVLEKVCIYDDPIHYQDIPALKAGLELLAQHFGFNPSGERKEREAHRRPRR